MIKAKNKKENMIRRNQIKIWVFGVLTLILVIMAISLSMTGQKEMVTPVDADGSTVYIPSENAVNFFCWRDHICYSDNTASGCFFGYHDYLFHKKYSFAEKMKFLV